MASNTTLLLLLFITMLTSALTLLTLPSTISISSDAMAHCSDTNSTEFIRRSCSTTLYPDLCFTSLARYAYTIKQDPIRLARFAASVSHHRVYAVWDHVSTLYCGEGGMDSREAAALRDCLDVLDDAADLSRRSAAEMKKLETAEGWEVALLVGNAQTWMSAAITDEETCMDGFEFVEEGSVKTDVCGRVTVVEEYTSNALALVNRLVEIR